MGFPRARCEKALHATGNSDATAAMEWLFQHMEDADIDTPLDLGGAAGEAAVNPQSIELLTAMGFGIPQAKKALRETQGNVERAVEWLFSHPDDQGVFDDEAAVPPMEATLVGSSAVPAKFQLQSIVCHKGTSIHTG